MPVYTYRCQECGFQFDQHQSFTAEPLIRCPECEENALRKVYQPVGIVFKGSGFYATDHKSPSGASYRANEKNGEKEKKEDGEKKPEAESKPKQEKKEKVAETKED